MSRRTNRNRHHPPAGATQATPPAPQTLRVRDTDNQTWPDKFFAALRDTANVRLSAEFAGVDHSTVYRHRETDAAFAQRWLVALEEACDLLEARAREHALSDDAKASVPMLQFLLKAHRPSVYGNKVDATINLKHISDAELLASIESDFRTVGGGNSGSQTP